MSKATQGHTSPPSTIIGLDSQTLHLVLESLDGAGQIACLVGGDAGSDHSTANTAGAAQGNLAGHEHVRRVLVLTQEGNVQQNSQGVGVGGEDGNLAGVAIEGLGDFVGTLLGLPVVSGRLQQIENLLRQGRVGQGPGCDGKVSIGTMRVQTISSRRTQRGRTSRLLVTRHLSGGKGARWREKRRGAKVVRVCRVARLLEVHCRKTG